MEKVTFKVEGMSCGHCKASVEKGLSKLTGVSKVEVSLEEKEVTVTHDGTVTLGAMKRAVEDLGYSAI
jgi:copper chaperone